MTISELREQIHKAHKLIRENPSFEFSIKIKDVPMGHLESISNEYNEHVFSPSEYAPYHWFAILVTNGEIKSRIYIHSKEYKVSKSINFEQ